MVGDFVWVAYCKKTCGTCNSTAIGWARLGYIQVPVTPCPSGIDSLTTPTGEQLCVTPGNAGCHYTPFYPRFNYTEVCGRVIGSATGTPDGMVAANSTIDSPYVDGLSITYTDRPFTFLNNPSQHHIWTFAAGQNRQCPCHPSSVAPPPPDFVGEHYYCDLATPNYDPGNPLWDRTSCPTTGNCEPPWFYRKLSLSTFWPIEVRWCTNEGAPDERIGVKTLELYIR